MQLTLLSALADLRGKLSHLLCQSDSQAGMSNNKDTCLLSLQSCHMLLNLSRVCKLCASQLAALCLCGLLRPLYSVLRSC